MVSPHTVTAGQASSFTHDVAIIGLGYVGLPTALTFHAAGARVLGVDVSERRLDDIRAERVDLLDSDRVRLTEALSGDALELTASVAAASSAAAMVICVPTPVTEELSPDLRALKGACAAAVEHAVPGQVLILTSTTYVGCTEDLLVRPLRERGLEIGTDVFVAFSPERIDPGNDRHAHEDVPRVVGGTTERCTAAASKVLSRYNRHIHEVSGSGVAEMSKLLENTFRAVNIAMANEFANASRQLGIDIMEVIDAAATKPYGFMPFYPGPGAGGHCIPCDPHYLLWQMRKERVVMNVVENAMNDIAMRPGEVVHRVRELLSDHGKGLRGAKVLVLGVAYKPGVEDIRESPALEIIERLLDAGADVSFHDQLIQEVTIRGRKMTSVDLETVDVDLVLAHTPQRGGTSAWIKPGQLVLDATYRMAGLAGRHAL
ncbi:nucleotide sugar dehydrogenase [Actinocorallia longicatena]|uniref:Nucleotide sugar dehydrogenase n=1 Tax=Actinocorallia longicatena TaxID=111803 RepID=A0ABP6QHV8_9ACTN